MAKLKVAVIGAGMIGRPHAELIARTGLCDLAAIVEPSDGGREFAARMNVPWYRDQDALLAAQDVDAAIVATPNQTHLPVSLAFLAKGVPVLVEKPITSTIAEAQELTAASERTGVPVLVGHHRRHNPIIRRARAMIAEGAVGTLTAASVLYAFLKPDPYFDLEWRRKPGGGPVLINLIHEIDLIRFVCGEIASVQAVTSNARRGFEVEDTAAVILRLAGGALVSISLSDTAVSPWSWDMASRESAHYPVLPAPVNSHYLMGTEGAITLPQLQHWRYDGKAGWHEPIALHDASVARGDPYEEQLRHLVGVVRGEEAPLISAADGTRTLQATLAVHEAARLQAPVALG
jgi:predicted dehydrogenase